MKIYSSILLYSAMLMVLSQTPWKRSVIFLSVPLILLLINKKRTINKSAFSKLIFLGLLILVGFTSGLLNLENNNLHYFIRDILYFIQTPLYVLLGFFLYAYRQNYKSLLQVIILSSLAITLYYLSFLILNPSLIFQLDLKARYSYSLSNPTAIFSLIIVLYARRLKFKLFDNYIELLVISISLISIGISLSRTYYLLTILVMLTPYIYNSKALIKLYGFIIFAILFVTFGGALFEIRSDGKKEFTFLSKVEYSLNEMVVRDYSTNQEVNHNWRGFEAYMGLSKYKKGNTIQLIFGQGFGAIVETPFWVFGGTKHDIVPAFHNGYLTIILKTGLVGLLFFFIFLFTLLKKSIQVINATNTSQKKLSGMILQSIVFIILLQTFVIHGLFRTTAPIMLLLLLGITLQDISTKKVMKKLSINY